MKVLRYAEFRNNLSKTLNQVSDGAEAVIVSRSKGKNVAIISLYEYNSIMETLYLTKSEANRKRLQEAIEEMNAGNYIQRELIE